MTLSDADLERWTRALRRMPEPGALLHWMQSELKQFFPFEQAVLIHAELLVGRIEVTHCLACGHSAALLGQLAQPLELHLRSGLRWWLVNRKPLLIDPAEPAEHVSAFELSEIAEHGIVNVAAHGVINPRATAGTYCSFSGLQAPLGVWHQDALRLIAPVLNDLLLTYIAQGSDAAPPMHLNAMSGSDQTLLRLLVDGLDDKTIATEMAITEKAVRNRLSRLYRRFGTTRRTQLIALLR